MDEKQPMRILYITDDIDTGTLLQIILKTERNDKVILCDPSNQSPEQAVTKEKPDLIFIEPRLPDVDSLELCREFKAHPAIQKIPILFWCVTGKLEKFYTMALEVGAAGCLDYFAQPSELVEARDIALSGGIYKPELSSSSR